IDRPFVLRQRRPLVPRPSGAMPLLADLQVALAAEHGGHQQCDQRQLSAAADNTGSSAYNGSDDGHGVSFALRASVQIAPAARGWPEGLKIGSVQHPDKPQRFPRPRNTPRNPSSHPRNSTGIASSPALTMLTLPTAVLLHTTADGEHHDWLIV